MAMTRRSIEGLRPPHDVDRVVARGGNHGGVDAGRNPTLNGGHRANAVFLPNVCEFDRHAPIAPNDCRQRHLQWRRLSAKPALPLPGLHRRTCLDRRSRFLPRTVLDKTNGRLDSLGAARWRCAIKFHDPLTGARFGRYQTQWDCQRKIHGGLPKWVRAAGCANRLGPRPSHPTRFAGSTLRQR
jgi:hypothetical protein